MANSVFRYWRSFRRLLLSPLQHFAQPRGPGSSALAGASSFDGDHEAPAERSDFSAWRQFFATVLAGPTRKAEDEVAGGYSARVCFDPDALDFRGNPPCARAIGN